MDKINEWIIPSVDKNTEPLELYHLVDGNAKWYKHSVTISYKVKHTPYNPEILLLVIYLGEIKTCMYIIIA